MKEYGIIYVAENKSNGKRYVGQTIRKLEERKRHHYETHKYNKNYFANAIKKYSIDGFNWKIIDNANSQNELNEKEKYYINLFSTMNPQKGYNTKEGGQYGGKYTDIAKQNMSNSQKGKKLSQETKEKIGLYSKGKTLEERYGVEQAKIFKEKLRNSRIGKLHSEEVKKRISESHKKSGMFKGERNPFYGKHHTDKTKEKISLANMGQISPMKGKHHTEEAKRKNGLAHCKLKEFQVRRIKFIAKYCKPEKGYWKKLAKSLNISQSIISQIINNKYWKYIEV